jgi:hypothetical protein
MLPWVFFVVGYAQGSAQIGGEVKRASRTQYLAMVGGVLVNGAVLALVVIVFTHVVSTRWIGSVGYLSNNDPGSLNLPGSVPPSFNFIVSLLTGNVLIPLIIGIGFVFWALLGTPLSELQATRYMLAWAVDRMIPSPMVMSMIASTRPSRLSSSAPSRAPSHSLPWFSCRKPACLGHYRSDRSLHSRGHCRDRVPVPITSRLGERRRTSDLWDPVYHVGGHRRCHRARWAATHVHFQQHYQ